MTGTQQASRAMSAGSGARPADHLRTIHRGWLRELREALEKVKVTDTTVWSLWSAIRYIDTAFSPQFDRERAAIEKLCQSIEANQAKRLWAAAELITAVRWQLHHSVGLCQHADEFSRVTDRLLKATELWFAEVEGALEVLSWAQLPTQVRQDLESFPEEVSHAG